VIKLAAANWRYATKTLSIMTFKYLEANITSNGNLEEEVQAQTTRAVMITCAI